MSALPIAQAFALALQHHQAGRLAEAEAIYRQVLAAEPRHADALHLLGVIAHQGGRNAVAVDLIRRAIALEPNAPVFHSNIGEAYRKLGQLDEAVAAYRRAIQFRPDWAQAHSNLGNALRDQGHLDESISACRRAIALEPDCAQAHSNLGNTLTLQGHPGEAIAAYRRAIQLQPDYAEAHSNLGIALRNLGHLDEASAAFCRAIQLKPGYAEAHSNLGNTLRDQGHLEEAIGAYHRAIQLQPDYAEAHNNLGSTLRDQGHLEEATIEYRRSIEFQPDYSEAHGNLGSTLAEQGCIEEAIAEYRRAIELQPGCAETHNNLGVALASQGHLEEALAVYRRAIQLKPDFAGAIWNSSLLLLLLADFERGWPLFEVRWEIDYLKPGTRNFPQPMWRGEALNGQRVLLHAEQGLGDTLQFVRYAPLVAQRGGHVVIECQPALKTLLTSIEGISQVLELGEPLPAFDLHCPLMSLPLAFGTRVETIPADIPYVRADAVKAARWRQRLDQESEFAGSGDFSQCGSLKIGLVWAGGERPHQPRLRPVDERRSMHLSQFAPLATVPGVIFVSLQKGGPAAQARTPPEGMRLLDWTDELKDFADTAALVECLDLVISVDTAVAHLAGALGKPVWMLNRFDTCWRWLTEREDSPWYPTMRLFRQSRFMDWEPVIASVREQLQTLAQVHSNPSSRQP